MNEKQCEYIVTNAKSVEAAIVINDSGQPVCWYTRKDNIIDEVAAISSSLVSIARNLSLFDTSSDGSMIFETGFGALNIRTIGSGTLLVLCLTEGYSFLTINRILQNLSIGSS
jgi:hypothetical protein